MRLIIRNDLGDMFEHNCDHFDGFEIFELANDQWDNWNSYMVIFKDQILESVINPNNIDPESSQYIH